jgi:UDP-N-acetylglucosamine 1-carboxyvinyltransferase
VATDVQSQLMALAALAEGTSVIRDAVFPDRLRHVAELNRLGADIVCDGSTAIVRGVGQLTGADVVASDLRASAALVLAGLAAAGETVIHRVAHLDRGYERLDHKLTGLAARILRSDGDMSISASATFPMRRGVAA